MSKSQTANFFLRMDRVAQALRQGVGEARGERRREADTEKVHRETVQWPKIERIKKDLWCLKEVKPYLLDSYKKNPSP